MISESKIKVSEWFKNWAEIIAICIAAVWAFYTFKFETEIAPASEPPYLNISSIHTIDGEKDSFYLVRSTVLIRNTGKIRSFLHAGSFNITVFRVQEYKQTDSQYAKLVSDYIGEAPCIPRFTEENTMVVNAGKIIEDEWRMDPEEEYTRSIISLVPKNKFHALRFYTEIYASRKKDKDLRIKWHVDQTGIINIELRKMPQDEPLDSEKHQAFIDNMALGRCYNMEEIVLTSKR